MSVLCCIDVSIHPILTSRLLSAQGNINTVGTGKETYCILWTMFWSLKLLFCFHLVGVWNTKWQQLFLFFPESFPITLVEGKFMKHMNKRCYIAVILMVKSILRRQNQASGYVSKIATKFLHISLSAWRSELECARWGDLSYPPCTLATAHL